MPSRSKGRACALTESSKSINELLSPGVTSGDEGVSLGAALVGGLPGGISWAGENGRCLVCGLLPVEPVRYADLLMCLRCAWACEVCGALSLPGEALCPTCACAGVLS